MSLFGKKTLTFLLLLAVLLPGLSGFLKPGFYAAHDAVWHIARFWQFNLSLESGQFPVRWAPTLFYGLGYPAFIVNFHLPYYLMEVIYRFGFSLVDTYKILMAASYVFGAYFLYLYLRRFFGILPSFTSAIVFAYAPYRFATLFARGALGEAVAIAFVPLVLIGFDSWTAGKRYAGPFLALSIFLLITSHASIFAVFLPIFVMLAIADFVKKKIIDWKLLVWIFLGIVATSFQALPALFEKRYMLFDQIYKNVYTDHFVNLFSVFHINFGGADLNTPFQLGLAGTLSFLIFLIVFARGLTFKKSSSVLVLVFVVAFFIALLMMSSISRPVWEGFPFLNLVLFPWRFINLLVVASAFLCAYVLDKFGLKILFALLVIVVAIIPSRHFWGWVGQIPQEDNYYREYDGTTTAEGEFTPKGIAENLSQYKNPKVEIVDGNAVVLDQNISSNKWYFNVDAKQESLIKLSILNFPGWSVRVDGVDENIVGDYKDENNDLRGLIIFRVASGLHYIKVHFEETGLRKAANVISLISLITLLWSIVKRKKFI